MKDLYLIGAGGFSTEILHLVELIQEKSKRWNQVFFIDETMEPFSKELRGVKVVGGLEVIEKTEAEIDVVITINNTVAIKRIVETLKINSNIQFPNIYSPYAIIDEKYLQIGEGNIVMHFCILSTHLTIGNFNTFNSYAGVGHDCIIGDYNSFGPRVAISGKVNIGNVNDFGVNSTVLDKKTIGNNNNIWMNTSIMKNIKSDGTYFGIPGKKYNYDKE